LAASVAALLGVTGIGTMSAPAWAQSAQASRSYDIQAGPLGQALAQFGRAAGVAISYDATLLTGKTTRGVRGSLTTPQALERLLRGTGLRASPDGASGFVIVATPPVAREARPRKATAAPRETGRTLSSSGPITDSIPEGLSDIVVVGSRSPQAVSEIPASVYVVRGEEIAAKTQAGVPFKELLGQAIPSLDVGPQGRTNYGQNLRGRAVLVMIDGVSITGSRAVSRQFDSIDPFNIARIEVLSGASSLYGGGATGGIINIVTKQGETGLHVTAQAGLLTDSHDSDHRAALSVSGGSDRVNGRLAIAWQKNGGAYDAHGNQILADITQTDLQYNESRDITGSLNFDLGAAGHLRLMGQNYKSQMSGDTAAYLGPNLVGALGTRPDFLAMRSGFSSDVVPSTRRNLFTADWSAPKLLFGQDLLVQGFWRNEKLDFYPFPGSASVTVGGTRRTASYYGTSRQNTEAYGVKSALVAHLGRATLTYGLDYTHETFDATQTLFNPVTAYSSGGLIFDSIGSVGRYPTFRTRQFAAFGQVEWKPFDNLTVNAGIRYQRTGVSIADFVGFAQQVLMFNGAAASADQIPGGRNHYQATLFNGGVVWSFAPSTQIYANYSEGFDLPDPAKYYGQGVYTLASLGGHFVLGNSTNVSTSPLSAIKTRQIEAGLRGTARGLRYSLAGFYALSDKAIYTVPVILSIEVIDRKVRTYGLEGQIAYRPIDKLEIGANGIVMRTEQRVAGNWEKQTVTTSSPPKLVAYARYGLDDAWLRLQSTSVFDLSDADANKLDGYTTLDLSGSVRTGQLRLTAGIQNLLNNHYQTIWSQRAQILYTGLVTPQALDFAGRGRSYSLTATLEF
jgi:iron complex outermembrane receptor protein